MYKLHVKETQKCMRHAVIPKYIFFDSLTWLLRSRSQWQKTVSDIPWPQHISTNWIWGLICHIIWNMLFTLCFACCWWVVLSVNCFCLHTTVMLTVCYINRQPGRGYHYNSETNACGESVASKNIVVIDDFDLHIWQFRIDIVIFDRYLRYIFFNSLSSLITVLHTSGWSMFR